MNKFVGMVSAILLGALGVLALWLSYRLPDAPTPDSSTLTAYLSAPQPAAQPTTAPAGVAVPATVAGRVWEVYFTEGQHVRKGQLLLKVAQKLVSAEHHRLQQQLTRQQQQRAALVARQPTATATELAATTALVATTERQLAALPTQLSFQFVTAPHDGVMVRRSVAAGDYLSIGTAIGQLAPLPAIPNDTTLLLSRVN